MSPKIYYYETAHLFDRHSDDYDAGLPLLSLVARKKPGNYNEMFLRPAWGCSIIPMLHSRAIFKTPDHNCRY